MRDGDLVNLIRTFMVHVTSNQLTQEQLQERIGLARGSAIRSRLFLRLVQRVAQVWVQRLEAAEQIDFEDMLNRAADLIENGTWRSPYRLVRSTKCRTPATPAPGWYGPLSTPPVCCCSPSATIGSPSTGSPAPTCR